ncbi:NAD-dependent epimerase/dehydratase family protein [Nonomuraea sp. NPDC059023]|uniref:NAD-dependent epimerase/dehydratase family protein n=1 Tax=unclassified Nonomuraea TaxID=2593643 RepID=UPI003680A149
MRALVTGVAGFVGRHMAIALTRRGWYVEGCDLQLGDDAHDLFRDGIQQYDLVVHAAATAPHRAAIDGQPMNLAKDLALDGAMFEWAVRTNQRRVIYLSSSAAYPKFLQEQGTRVLLDESLLRVGNAHEPYDSYGWTKMTGERMAAAAIEAGLKVHIVRPFSGYGEDQGVDWPFGAFIARAQRRADPFVVWGDGEQRRDWIHIDDIVAAILAMVDQDVPGPVNLCTGRDTSFNELARLVCKEAGYEPELKHILDAPQGVAYRVGDPAKLHTFYKPKVELEDGIARALRAAR